MSIPLDEQVFKYDGTTYTLIPEVCEEHPGQLVAVELRNGPSRLFRITNEVKRNCDIQDKAWAVAQSFASCNPVSNDDHLIEACD